MKIKNNKELILFDSIKYLILNILFIPYCLLIGCSCIYINLINNKIILNIINIILGVILFCLPNILKSINSYKNLEQNYVENNFIKIILFFIIINVSCIFFNYYIFIKCFPK